MAQIVKLKRTAVSGKIPTTSNLELGELAMNTYDGRIFFEKDSGTPTVNEILTTNTENYITGSLKLNGDITASFFKGDGSQLTNLPAADVSQVATVTASFDTQSTINVSHNFNTKNVIVSVYDSNDNQIIPQTISLTNNNTAQIVLSAAQSGFVVVAKGGHIVSGSANDASNLNGQAGSYYLDYGNFTNIPSGIVSGSSQLNNTTINVLTINSGSFGSGSGSPTFSEFRYNNSNVMSFNQMYLGNQNGSYFSNGEYQKVVTIIPSGDAQNYQIVGRVTAQNAGETHTVYFNAALRSNTLPDLNWTITYHEEYNGSRYINPLLWTKETTTAGFIFAFETLGTIYGNVTVDMDVIPRSSALLDNVTVNTNQSSEQSSVDTGYTSNSFTKVRSQQGTTLEVYGNLLPDTTEAYDLGSTSKRWRDLYLSGSTIDLGGTLITRDGTSGDINFKDSSTQELKTVVVKELQIGTGASARKVKVDGGSIKFTDKDDVERTSDLSLPAGVVSGSAQITDLTTYKEAVSGASSYSVTHNLNESYPIVQAWNTSTKQQEVPSSITSNSANQVTVVFSSTFGGVIIVKK